MAAGIVAVLLVTATVAPAAAGAVEANAADGTDQSGYAGAHVSFDASGDAVSGYAVDDATLLERVETESKSSYRSRTGAAVGVGVDLGAVTELSAADVSLEARTETSATVASESGAELRAHDNAHGVLVVEAADGGQLVKADVGANATARTEEADRVVVETDGGERGTFVVVGDGAVSVNEEGDVVADLEEDAKLVFRAYVDEERDDEDRTAERMIADGTAAAEVHVEERDGGHVADVVTYADDTSVEVANDAENEVEVTVERTESEGKVVIAHVTESAVGSVEDLTVRVDGEAAAEASSYSELEAAAAGGEASKYMVRQTAGAEGSAEVLVALNHFSTRTVAMGGGDGTATGGGTATGDDADATTTDGGAASGDGGDDGTPIDGGTPDDAVPTESPGFGFAVAIAGLFSAAMAARRR